MLMLLVGKSYLDIQSSRCIIPKSRNAGFWDMGMFDLTIEQ